MTKKDIVVKINSQTRMVYFSDNFLGLSGENLQGNLIFEFNDAFVSGTPRLEVQFMNGSKYIIVELSRVNDTYVMPIKSSLLANGDITMQLVITELQEGEHIPIFKSKRFTMIVPESINASMDLPDEYETLYDRIMEAIAEANTLDLDAERVEDGVEVTLTKKDGTTKTVKVNDGQGGSGSSDHSQLENLDYESSGHTGFQPAGDYIEDSNYVHTDNNFTNTYKQQIDTNKNNIETLNSAVSEHDQDIQNIQNDIDAIEQDIDDLGTEIDNLDLNKVPTSRKINNKQLNQDITLTPQDIGIGSVFTLKGSVATVELLPSTGNQIGDVYYVESEEVGYIWLEKLSVLQWEQLGLPIDLSNYYNKTQTDTLLNNKQNILTSGENISIVNDSISVTGLQPVIINASSNTTINGYQVPQLTSSQITQIYNGIVAGKEVVVSDATGNMHFKVNQADSVSGEVFVSFLYYDIMLLEYDENANITYKEIASKSYVDSQIGNAIEGSY